MKIRIDLLKLLTISLLIFCRSVYAEFGKASNAYLDRDSALMLSEVKEAVNKKSDEGLLLFMIAANLDEASSDYDPITHQSKSTLRALLPGTKWDELRDLLKQAALNSTVDTQYYFILKSVFKIDIYNQSTTSEITHYTFADYQKRIISEYVERGSRAAMLDSTLEDRAKAGNPISQLSLSLKYFNYGKDVDYGAHYGCQYLSKEPICQVKNEPKAEYWMNEAVSSFDRAGYEDFDLFSSQMCEFLANTAHGDLVQLKQAYLWALLGIHERANIPKSQSCLSDLHYSGNLKLIEPQVDAAWESKGDTFNAFIYKTQLVALPNLIVKSRERSAPENLPIVTYHFEKIVLEIFKDGRVMMSLNDNPQKALLMKVTTNTLKAFLSELKATGFYNWTTENSFSGVCPDFNTCKTIDMHFSARHGSDSRRLFFSLLKTNFENSSNLSNAKRMAILKVLMDKYFPTEKVRCELGNSIRYKQTCLASERHWFEISKWEK